MLAYVVEGIMKKIGLIGGMSWESSVVYYEIMNQTIRELVGGFSSARCILESVDFAQIEALQSSGDWETLNVLMASAAKNLENGGAELIILCTNTMHLCTEAIKKAINVPFLHIAEATGVAIKKQNLNKILLLGTKFTMEKDFYKDILKNKFSIDTIIPNDEDREIIHRIIFGELVHGVVAAQSKKEYQKIIEKSVALGAQGVVLGCTEIPLLIKATDSPIPIFDTTAIHATMAIKKALE